MKYVVLMLVVLAVVSATPAHDKRVLGIQTIGNIINNARDQFNRLTHGIHIDFHGVVQRLIPLIDSDLSKAACAAVCRRAASAVLQSAASLAGELCPPVCDAALAQLAHVAG